MKNHLAVIPIAVLLGATLSSCGNNEDACAKFESDYNAANLRDKMLFTDGDSFNEALERLGKRTETTLEDASGEVERQMSLFASQAEFYIRQRTDPSSSSTGMDIIDQRVRLWADRDDVVDACEESGNPIELEEDHPVK